MSDTNHDEQQSITRWLDCLKQGDSQAAEIIWHRYFEKLVQSAIDSVPECASREAMRQLVRLESERLVPREACDKFRHVEALEAVDQSNRAQAATKSVAV